MNREPATVTVNAFKDLKVPYSGKARVLRTYLDTGHILAGGVGREPGRYHYWVGLWSAARGDRPDPARPGNTPGAGTSAPSGV